MAGAERGLNSSSCNITLQHYVIGLLTHLNSSVQPLVAASGFKVYNATRYNTRDVWQVIDAKLNCYFLV